MQEADVMLRLTVREGPSGRLLGRIVHTDGATFVLDYGDRAFIEDASTRAHEGASGTPWGVLAGVRVSGGIGVLVELAMHYLERGLLVAIDEPTEPHGEGEGTGPVHAGASA